MFIPLPFRHLKTTFKHPLDAGIIASKRCDNLKIYDNEVYDGGKNAVGIFLHRSSDDAEVYSECTCKPEDRSRDAAH